MKLVIAEKPSVAQTIADVLGAKKHGDGFIEGNGYRISWCIGHLVGLADPEAYGEQYKQRSFETLPVLPSSFKFAVNPEKREHFNTLKKLMNDSSVDEIICATDAGREGECIFRYVYLAAQCHKPFRRLWISSMEAVAIKEGFENLRPGKEYDNLYAAGLCRAKADWLVGINLSRLFSLRYHTSLNVGRVQTPTLAMIVKRDKQIKNFVKEKYFTVDVEIAMPECLLRASSDTITDEAKADKLAAACNGSSAIIREVKSEKKTENPPKLYDLTTLQRESNRFYGYTAKQTLDSVQALYEKKLCTYPRTDSQYITEDMHDTFVSATETAREFAGISSDNINPMPIINNKKVSDHHALLITQEVKDYDLTSLTEKDRNILFLIAARMILASSDPHIYEASAIVLSCEDTEFRAKGKTVLRNGWKEQEKQLKQKIKNKNDRPDEGQEERVLPSVKAGEVFSPIRSSKSEHSTSSPKPYTEDTLLSAMETAGNKDYSDDADVEKKGLGTPATRDKIIEILVARNYVERKGTQLLPTDRGRGLIEILPPDTDITSPALTADWEKHLQMIERNEDSADHFMSEINGFVRDVVQKYSSVADNADMLESTIGKCPNCGKEIKRGKYGFYCTGKCGMIIGRVYGKDLTESQLKKLLDGKKVSYTSNGKQTTVLPEVIPNNYKKDGKEIKGFQWKTKSAAKS